MKNGSATPDNPSPRPAADQAGGRLRVTYDTGMGIMLTRLNNVPAGTLAITGGTIRDLRLHGDEEDPRATFYLIDDTGESAVVAVGTDAYFDSHGDLAEGRKAEIHGTVMRPFRSGPAYLQLVSLYLA